MTGVRVDGTGDNLPDLPSGGYGKDANGVWFCRPPQGDGFACGIGSLEDHSVTEHEDGTVSVSPSILATGHGGVQWHGYLERGVWRKC